MTEREAAFNGLRHDYGTRRRSSQWREEAPQRPTLMDKIEAAYKPQPELDDRIVVGSGSGRPNPVARARMTSTQTVDAAILTHLRKLRRNDGWIAVTRSEWAEALMVDEHLVKAALDRLKAAGSVEADYSRGFQRVMWRATKTRIRDEDGGAS